MVFKKFSFVFLLVLLVEEVSAHCPLCTIGAGAAAGAAVWLGVSKIVVALFIGAFAMSMGLWFSRIVKKKYLPFQKTLIVLLVFLTTLVPLIPIFSAIGPLYLPFIGEYGRTFALDYSIVSSLLGAGLVFISPKVSRKVTLVRDGRMVPFQGVIITFSLLVLSGLIIQVLV